MSRGRATAAASSRRWTWAPPGSSSPLCSLVGGWVAGQKEGGACGGARALPAAGAAGLASSKRAPRPPCCAAADVERVVSAAYYPSAAIPNGSRSISWPIRHARLQPTAAATRPAPTLPAGSSPGLAGAACACGGPSVPTRVPPRPSPLAPRRPQLRRAVPEFLAAANDEVTVMVQIETKQSLEELEVRGCGSAAAAGLGQRLPAAAAARQRPLERTTAALPGAAASLLRHVTVAWCTAPPPRLPACPQSVLSVSAAGVDCAFVGPVDLSHSLGLAQSHGFPACFDAPEFKARLAGRLPACLLFGAAACCPCCRRPACHARPEASPARSLMHLHAGGAGAGGGRVPRQGRGRRQLCCHSGSGRGVLGHGLQRAGHRHRRRPAGRRGRGKRGVCGGPAGARRTLRRGEGRHALQGDVQSV